MGDIQQKFRETLALAIIYYAKIPLAVKRVQHKAGVGKI
jgi:hypothetical protein